MILIFGFFGYNNFGDDLMLKAFLERLPCKLKKKVKVVTVGHYGKDFSEVEYIIFKGRLDWIRLAFELCRARRVIWCGGTCFYSNQNKKGLAYLGILTKLAGIFGKRLDWIGIGIGKLEKLDSKKVIGYLKKARRILVRDKFSLEFCKQDGIDACLIRDLAHNTRFLKNLLSNVKHQHKDDIFVFTNTVRYENLNHYSALMKLLQNSNIKNVIIHCNTKEEYKLLAGIVLETGTKINIFYNKEYNWILDKLVNSEKVISERYHGVLVCEELDLDYIPIRYARKTDLFLTQHSNKKALKVSEYSDEIKQKSILNWLNNE